MKAARSGATTSLKQLLHEMRSTIQVLDVNVQRACKADRENGPTTKTAWETAKSVRKAPVATDVPWPPSASGSGGTATIGTTSQTSASGTSAGGASVSTPTSSSASEPASAATSAQSTS